MKNSHIVASKGKIMLGSAEKNFQKALELFKHKELEKSEEICLQVLKKHPHHGNSLNLLGVITWKHGKPQKAIELIEKAIANHEEKAPIFSCNLAIVYTHTHQIQQAANCYKKAGDLFYEREEFDEALNALLNGAYLLRDHGFWAESKLFYQKILELNPFHVDACNDYGLILQNEGNLEGAKAYFKKVLNIDPKYVNGYINLGALFQMEKKPNEAATLFEKCLELDPECVEAYTNLSMIYRQEERLDKALEYGKKALELQPNHPGLLNNLGILYFQKGDKEEAIAQFKKCLTIDPNYLEAQKNLALAQDENG